jgi:hypothetical protein
VHGLGHASQIARLITGEHDMNISGGGDDWPP